MSPPNHDDGIKQLVADFQNGYLTRRGFLAQAAAFGLTAAAAVGLLGAPTTQKSAVAQGSPPEVSPKKWEKGKGWGWVWGCLLYTSPSPRDRQKSRMPSSA